MREPNIYLARKVAFPLFFAGALASAISLTVGASWWFAAMFLAHLGLFIILLTESFGPVAASRSAVSRSLSRVFLLISGAVVLGVVLSGLRSTASELQWSQQVFEPMLEVQATQEPNQQLEVALGLRPSAGRANARPLAER